MCTAFVICAVTMKTCHNNKIIDTPTSIKSQKKPFYESQNFHYVVSKVGLFLATQETVNVISIQEETSVGQIENQAVVSSVQQSLKTK